MDGRAGDALRIGGRLLERGHELRASARIDGEPGLALAVIGRRRADRDLAQAVPLEQRGVMLGRRRVGKGDLDRPKSELACTREALVEGEGAEHIAEMDGEEAHALSFAMAEVASTGLRRSQNA